MEYDRHKTGTETGPKHLQSLAIVCSMLIFSTAPYTILFALRVPLHGHTQVFYYFNALVILPFLAAFGIVCSFRLLERNIWREFGIALGIASVATCAFVLHQWIRFDLLIWKRTVVPEPWKAIIGGVALAFVLYLVATRIIGIYRRKLLAQVMLLFSSLCIAISACNAFQFLPRFLDQGDDLRSLDRFLAEDMLNVSAPLFSLKTPQGETYNIERDRGKVILVDFWATWCGPCIAEMPHLEKLYRELGDPRVSFLALSTDRDTSKVKPFIESHGYTFTTLYTKNEVTRAYRIEVIPTTFIVDKKGIIRKVMVGFHKDRSPGAMRSFIRKLFDE